MECEFGLAMGDLMILGLLIVLECCWCWVVDGTLVGV